MVKNNYILVYAYDPQSEIIRKMIESIPGFQNYSIQTILLGPKNLNNYFNRKIHSAIYVQDFLSFFKYASFVITDSFHGLAFSLLFEKNFNVSYYKGKSLRPQALLNELNLEDRLVSNVEHIRWDSLDYSIINRRISIIREESRNYLLKSLEG